jgi:hypothetical protein
MSFDVTKVELLRRLEHEYHLLAKLVDQFTPEQALEPGLMGSWSLRDFLAHLIAHEQRVLAELQAAQYGQVFLIDHAAINSFNAGAVFSCRMIDFATLQQAWHKSYQAVCDALIAISDLEFLKTSFTVQYLKDSIDGALANNTYAHYAEHRARVQEWLEQLQNIHG